MYITQTSPDHRHLLLKIVTMYPLTLISLSIAVTLSSCRPDGAPLKSCRSMTPQHRGFPIPLIPQQTGASPYAFNAVWDSHMRMVRVSVSGNTVQGFLIQGRLAKSGPAIGRFVNITENPNAHYQNCSADKVNSLSFLPYNWELSILPVHIHKNKPK